MRKPALLILVVGVLLAYCHRAITDDAGKDEAIKKERSKYEGTWRVDSLEVDGNKASDDDARKITVINRIDGTWVICIDGSETYRGTSEIDPTKKPKTIDFTPTEGDAAGMKHLGIYEIEENTRRLCFAKPGQERPTEFSAPAGSGHLLVTFKREKSQ